MNYGFIHSFESMGLVDGPGIRSVVFMKGCKLRCKFCHNPDTWSFQKENKILPTELLKKLIKFKPYYEKSNGGVTFSGGEPLLQPEFLCEMLKLCKQNKIHTCIDTAGVGNPDYYNDILKNTDLILYDVKHYLPDEYFNLTKTKIDQTLQFVEFLKQCKVPIWVRHVVVPNITDSEKHLQGLREYIKTLPNVQKVELLPYHILGENKYKLLGIPYPLEGIPQMDKQTCLELQQKYFSDFGGNKK